MPRVRVRAPRGTDRRRRRRRPTGGARWGVAEPLSRTRVGADSSLRWSAHLRTKGAAEMGKDDPVALYIAAYDDPNAAQQDYDALKELVKAGAIFVDVAALVARDDEGKLYVKENRHE